ncbi:MAG TPA: hypothetical protein PLG31_11850 [Spirochaetota bacterium]|nr:hypothetical protein [Spirochaetota bacterium]
MKKNSGFGGRNGVRLILIAMAVLCLVPAFRTASPAADLTVGAVSWYAWWNGFYNDTTKTETDLSNDNKTRLLMYGPVISLGLGDWSISTRFIAGNAEVNEYEAYSYDRESDVKLREKAFKYDSDTTAGYAVSKHVKLFAGVKVMGYQYEKSFWEIRSKGKIVYRHILDYTILAGPGGGIGFSVGLSGDLFLFMNITGIYVTGVSNEKSTAYCTQRFEDENGVDKNGVTVHHADMVQWGGNGDFSLAYFFSGARTIIAVGIRYQHLKCIEYNRSNVAPEAMERDGDDRFYGFTVSALHTFEL